MLSSPISMEEYVDNLLAENGALRRKLQSKAEALLILSKELDECRKERDQFQLMAEQLQHRYTDLKKKSYTYGQGCSSMGLLPSGDCTTMEERNKALRMEAESLRQQLRDAHEDSRVLRTKLIQQKIPRPEPCNFPAHQKEEMVQQLEAMHIKSSQLGRDLQSLLDEKEELVVQRDSLRCKVHRLNHELHQSLTGGGAGDGDVGFKIDIDSLVTENTYLHDRLQQAEQDKELMNQNIAKYKSMLDKKRNKGAIKLGSNTTSGMVISHKQVQQLFQRGGQVPNTAAALSDMRSLCLALLEALNDKGTALTHQKKTNRILGRRVAELERRLGGEGEIVFPSRALLAGYVVADVDKEVDQILAEAEKTPSSPASTSNHQGAVKTSEEDDDEDGLPPQLQQMVLKALEDIKKESQTEKKSPSN